MNFVGFVLKYRKEHDSWKEVNLGSKNRTFTDNNLLCGTGYKFSITAYNKLGHSGMSNTVSARTNGSGNMTLIITGTKYVFADHLKNFLSPVLQFFPYF